MKIFVFGELNDKNILKICSDAKIIGKKTLSGYKCCYNKGGKSFLVKAECEITGFVVECDTNDIWNLDQWKDTISLRRELVDEDLYAYVSLYDDNYNFENESATAEDFENFVKVKNDSKINSLNMADIHLLIPGYCAVASENAEYSKLGQLLQSQIEHVNSQEIDSDFLKECRRYALGEIFVYDKNNYKQKAVLTMMKHKVTNLCVLDIFVPAITISANKMLERFCAGRLKVNYFDIDMNLNELCSKLNITKFGKRRSMVFSYDNLSEEKLLNILVNEENPMGKIVGTHFKNVISDNIAQYDTAKVYVSSVTMIELMKDTENDLFERINSQAIELFFVEMLLLQDAAVSKLYDKVLNEIEEERKNPIRKNQGKVLRELVKEASFAINFTDYNQFYFPTVRVSALKVAKAFGIDEIEEKYERSKKILEQMIKDNSIDIAAKENKIKNSLLIIITILSGIKTIYEAFSNITHYKYENIAYYISVAIMFIGIIVFFAVKKIVRVHTLKIVKKYNKTEKD